MQQAQWFVNIVLFGGITVINYIYDKQIKSSFHKKTTFTSHQTLATTQKKHPQKYETLKTKIILFNSSNFAIDS